jgi:hypothetical protein
MKFRSVGHCLLEIPEGMETHEIPVQSQEGLSECASFAQHHVRPSIIVKPAGLKTFKEIDRVIVGPMACASR